MGTKTVGAVFDTVCRIREMTAATVCKTVERTVAEQTAECFRVCPLVAGEILTFPVLKKVIMAHVILPNTSLQGVTVL